jgi:hypothetical protein
MVDPPQFRHGGHHLRKTNGLGRFRQPVDCGDHVLLPTTPRCEVLHAARGPRRPPRTPPGLGALAHAHRPMRPRIDGPCVALHAVVESPVLVRVLHMALQVAAKPIRGAHERIAPGQGPTAKPHLRGLGGVPLGFDADAPMQHGSTRLMPESPRGYGGLARFLQGDGVHVGSGSRVGIHLLPLCAAGSTPPGRARIGHRARGRIPQRRAQLAAPLAAQVQGIVRTACPLAQQGHDRAGSAARRAHPLARRWDATQRRAPCHRAPVAMRAPVGPASSAPGLRFGRRLHPRLGGRVHVRGQERGRRAALATAQGDPPHTQARHRLPIERGKKPSSALGPLARVGPHPRSPTPHDALLGVQHMRAHEAPLARPPRPAGRATTLDRPGPAAWAGPAGEASHGHPTVHGQPRLAPPTQGAPWGGATHWLQHAHRTIMSGLGGGASCRLGWGHP